MHWTILADTSEILLGMISLLFTWMSECIQRQDTFGQPILEYYKGTKIQYLQDVALSNEFK